MSGKTPAWTEWGLSVHQFLLHSLFVFLLNPLNVELIPICSLLALLRAHHIFHVSGLRVNVNYAPSEENVFFAWNHLQCLFPAPPVHRKQLLQGSNVCECSIKNLCWSVSGGFWHTAQNSQQAHKNSGGGGRLVSSGIKNHTISRPSKRNVFLFYSCPLVQDFATVSYDFILHGAVEEVYFTKLSATSSPPHRAYFFRSYVTMFHFSHVLSTRYLQPATQAWASISSSGTDEGKSAVAYTGGGVRMFNPRPPNSEGPPKHRAKLNPIVKTV